MAKEEVKKVKGTVVSSLTGIPANGAPTPKKTKTTTAKKAAKGTTAKKEDTAVSSLTGISTSDAPTPKKTKTTGTKKETSTKKVVAKKNSNKRCLYDQTE